MLQANFADCYIEVKSVTLAERNGYFPTPSPGKGENIFGELMGVAAAGIKRGGGVRGAALAITFSPARHIDTIKYAQLARRGSGIRRGSFESIKRNFSAKMELKRTSTYITL